MRFYLLLIALVQLCYTAWAQFTFPPGMCNPSDCPYLGPPVCPHELHPRTFYNECCDRCPRPDEICYSEENVAHICPNLTPAPPKINPWATCHHPEADSPVLCTECAAYPQACPALSCTIEQTETVADGDCCPSCTATTQCDFSGTVAVDACRSCTCWKYRVLQCSTEPGCTTPTTTVSTSVTTSPTTTSPTTPTTTARSGCLYRGRNYSVGYFRTSSVCCRCYSSGRVRCSRSSFFNINCMRSGSSNPFGGSSNPFGR